MPPLILLTGQVFGRLTAMERVYPENLSSRQTYYRCICVCGKETISTAANLKSGKATSCGCYREERIKESLIGNQFSHVDLVGRVYGYLTVLFRTPKKPRAWYMCRCVCGNEKEFSAHILQDGYAKSCGCKTGEMIAEKVTKHGHSANGITTPELNSHKTMLARTSNPNATGHERYHDRGIRTCERWLGPEGFKNFLEDMGPRPEGYTLERQDLDGDYTPENTFWADTSTQARNRSNNRFYTLNGLTLCVTDWAVKIKIHPSALYRRIEERGWPLELALTLPPCAKVERDPQTGQWQRLF